MTVSILDVPAIARKRRLRSIASPTGSTGWSRYGFMQRPDVPEALASVKLHRPIFSRGNHYYLAHLTLFVNNRIGYRMARPAVHLSVAQRPARAFFQIPPDRVVEIGMQLGCGDSEVR